MSSSIPTYSHPKLGGGGGKEKRKKEQGHGDDDEDCAELPTGFTIANETQYINKASNWKLSSVHV